jgi:O-antigen/teichoic acid export membrane protein
MNLKQKTTMGVKWSAVSAITVASLQFLTLAILAKLLSPSDFGLLGMIMVVTGFARLFADMGISNAIIYWQDATAEELSSLYWINIMAGMGVFLIIWASTPIIVDFYHEPRLENLIFWAALAFLITPFGQQFQILLQKGLQFDHLAKIDMCASLFNSVVSILLAVSGCGIFSIIYGQLSGTSLRVILLFCLGWKHWRPHLYFSLHGLKKYLNFGLFQVGDKTANYINQNIDYIIIGSLMGTESLGYYTFAYNLIIRPSAMINPIVTKVAFPVFSKIQNDIPRLRKSLLKIIKILSIVNFPILLGVNAIAPAAVPMLFGEQWRPSVILIQILSIVALLRSTGNPLGSLLLAMGKADWSFKWNVMVMFTQIPGIYIGAKLGGMIGVACAFVLLQIIYKIVTYPVILRKLLGPFLGEYVSSMWPALWTSMVMAVIVASIALPLQKLSLPLVLVIQILCGMTIYSGLIFWVQKTFVLEIKDLISK